MARVNPASHAAEEGPERSARGEIRVTHGHGVSAAKWDLLLVLLCAIWPTCPLEQGRHEGACRFGRGGTEEGQEEDQEEGEEEAEQAADAGPPPPPLRRARKYAKRARGLWDGRLPWDRTSVRGGCSEPWLLGPRA